jgi:toxin-antitoxin system PIN domain toxin
LPFLLDVNALIALVDPSNLHHGIMRPWFAANSHLGWATSPITENGFVRILATPSYPGRRAAPEISITNLRALKGKHASTYEFWDGVSISDSSLFYPERIAGPNQVTDAYLIALAIHHGRVLSFDRRLPWQAVRGATAESIFTP